MKPVRTKIAAGRRVAGGLAISAMVFVQNAGAFTIANNPPFLPTPMPPNIVLTLDDSGSMRWAFVPEDICSVEINQPGARRTKSADFNALYYDPNTKYEPPLDAAGQPLSTSFNKAWINGFYQSHGYIDFSADNSYRPTWAYDPSTNASNPVNIQCGNITPNNMLARNNTTDFPGKATSGVSPYYYVYNPTGTACNPAAKTNDACYTLKIVSSTSGPGTVDLNGDNAIDAADKDERQNFANWYSFYRTRNLLTISAASRAMAQVEPTSRFAWGALNTCASFTGSACSGWAGGNRDNRIRRFADISTPTNPLSTVDHKSNFYAWLFRLPANSGTPLRGAASRVGEYFRTSGNNSPYGFDPNQSPTVSGTEFSCRPNFHILMTDGLWNDSTGNFCSGASCGNRGDETSRTLPDGTAYSNSSSLTRIYRDGTSNTLADIAFHYWATDLRPTLDDKVLPYVPESKSSEAETYWHPKNDPATWQHVVMFTVGLGLKDTMNLAGLEWGALGTYSEPALTNLSNGTKTWPAATANASPGTVYDLWHAAINSRGQAFAADKASELNDALTAALNRIFAAQSSASALATNTTRLAAGMMIFQAGFNSDGWSGQLTATAVNSDGSLGAKQWEAQAPGKIPSHGLRKIFTWSGSAGIQFNQTELDAADLFSSIGTTQLLDYLRGDSSKEVRFTGGIFRNRKGPLGDIVNSDPAFVWAENFGYRTLPDGGANAYANFLASKNSRRKMLYVGSNAGFLHGFDAMTGEEKFAYVPNAVIGDLWRLANPNYTHRFYVDGSPTAWDAYFGGSWRTVLTGTTGAGAKSVFALDVTNPDSFAATSVQWELNQATPQVAGDAADPQYGNRLGYTLGQVVVAKLNNGEWAAIFGNGYSSSSNQASLYIVRVSDGRLIRRIDTGVGTDLLPNGLGTPTLYDENGDDVYDTVYAPDMRGNVWKFDLSGSSASSWDIAFATATGFPNGAPLFQARTSGGAVQPISARVELAAAPPNKSGVMVVFGTGRYFAEGDNTDNTQQTFYGIWDNGTRITQTDRSTLKARPITTRECVIAGDDAKCDVATTLRDVPSDTGANKIDWSTQRGWYMDLPDSGERVIGTAAVRGGRVVFTTLVPSSDRCDFGGSGWLMEVDATTGGQLPYSVFDTNHDKAVNSNDDKASGVRISVGMVKQPLVVEGSPTAAKFLSGTRPERGIQVERNRTFGPPLGRESWREVRR